LTFNLWLERVECEFLSGNFDKAEQLIGELLARAGSKVDQAAAYQVKVLLHIVKAENPQAVDSALECLRLFGIDLPAHPTFEQVQAEYETVWESLDGRPIESLIDLPMMTDPELQAAMQVLSVLTPASYDTDIRLFCLLVCRMVNVSVQHGMSGASAHGYAHLGSILGPVFHRYSEACRFAKLACDLVEKHGFIAYQAKAYNSMGLAAQWTQSITTAIDFLRAMFRAATETGDLTYACYAMYLSITNLIVRNDPLDAVWRESEMALDFVRKAGFRDVADIIRSQQRFIATMQGRTATVSTFSDAHFDEAMFEAQLTADRLAQLVCYYWIVKLKTRFLSGDYAEALAAADKVKPLLSAAAAQIQLLDYFYYTALTVAACYEKASAGEQQAWRELLTAHREQLREWAETYPPTFGDKHALVSAEIARIEGRELDAERLYEEAIRSAREHGFVQHEGLAHEIAARFYAARGFETFAHAYRRNARDCYRRWGAEGKVRQLEQLHPELREAPIPPPPTAMFGAPVEQLDIGAVVKASQAISGEIVLGRLIETLMTIALEHAGAERGLLILLRGDTLQIEAEARTDRKTVEVTLRQNTVTPAELPESILHTVIRTRQSVILDDASTQNPFSADEYIRQKRARSILCLPLVKQAKLVGTLYLENNLAPHVFTPARLAVLNLLSSQAAISLENTRLYRDLQEREAKIRRLVDSNIIGIVMTDFEGRILEANDAFLEMVGYDREDLASGRIRWIEMTPAEWLGVSQRAVAQLRATGSCEPFEKEYFRKDGSRVPVLVGAAALEGRDEGVSYVLDLTERKRAEAAVQKAQAELAHVARLTTMGELAASLAHEINQPLAAIVTNGSAGLRWLNQGQPDLDEARAALSRIVRDGARAADVIRGLRALAKKTGPELAKLDINETILEVLALTRSEMQRHGVVLHTDLFTGDWPVFADRVQLQQVLMNLILNGIEAMRAVAGHQRVLAISSEPAGPDGVLVAVADTGPGLDPATADRIFEPFFTTKPQGMGMGLSICRSIITAHGGQLWASPGVPCGAVFRFTVSRVPPG
jgi:PAS domain S-box-containing protein